jgi:FkbM family methyltransferase
MALKHTLDLLFQHPINKKNRFSSIVRYLKWQTGSRLLGAPVIYPWVNDCKFIVSKGDTGFTGNIYSGLHEFTDMAFLLHYLRKEDLFADIGANIGSYTILAGAVVGASTYSFEPVPATYSRLVQNIEINHLGERARSKMCAVGAKADILRFTTDHDTVNHVVADNEVAENVIEVPIDSLDNLLSDRWPNFLKIDVEGFESQVLEGAENLLRSPKVQAVIIEVNGSGNRYDIHDSEVIKKLENCGFEPHTYDPFSREIKRVDESNGYNGNIIFLNDPGTARDRVASADPFRVLGLTL